MYCVRSSVDRNLCLKEEVFNRAGFLPEQASELRRKIPISRKYLALYEAQNIMKEAFQCL